MNGINIVRPSFNRAGLVKGHDYFKGSKLVVPESQRDEYAKKYNSKRLIVIPDENDGNIAKKRNWILRNVERPLLMIDDDVSSMLMGEGKKIKSNGEWKYNRQIILQQERVEEVIINGFNLANDWGCVLWGINQNEDGRNYQQYRPFSLTNVVLGPFMGHLKHDLYYDERMGTKDDYDMSLQVLNKYRKILRFNKFSLACSHGDNKGGIVGMRTQGKEIVYCEAIMKKWGKKIIKYKIPPKKMGDLLNGVTNIPIAGV